MIEGTSVFADPLACVCVCVCGSISVVSAVSNSTGDDDNVPRHSISNDDTFHESSGHDLL